MIWDNGTWLEFVLIFLSLYTTCEKLSALYRRFFSSSAVLPSYLCLAELLEFMSDSFFYVNLSVIPLLGVLFKNALVLLVSKTQNGHTKDRLYLNPRLGVKWEGQSRGAGDFNVFSHTRELKSRERIRRRVLKINIFWRPRQQPLWVVIVLSTRAET